MVSKVIFNYPVINENVSTPKSIIIVKRRVSIIFSSKVGSCGGDPYPTTVKVVIRKKNWSNRT